MADTPVPRDGAALGALSGALVADALAMPVHWYYDTARLDRDYPDLCAEHYLAPRSPHADSILWRSQWTPPSPRVDILREQAEFWGRRGVHYHQFLAAGDVGGADIFTLDHAQRLTGKGRGSNAPAPRTRTQRLN